MCVHETLNIKIYFLASGKPCPAAMSSGVNGSKFEYVDYPNMIHTRLSNFFSLKLTLLENYESN